MTQTTTAVSDANVLKKPSSKGVSGLFTSKWINANLFFFLYLSILTVGYIAYGHWTEKTLRNINTTQQKLKDLQYEYKTVKSQVMNISGESEVLKAASPLGLNISNEVPKRLQLQSTNKIKD